MVCKLIHQTFSHSAPWQLQLQTALKSYKMFSFRLKNSCVSNLLHQFFYFEGWRLFGCDVTVGENKGNIFWLLSNYEKSESRKDKETKTKTFKYILNRLTSWSSQKASNIFETHFNDCCNFSSFAWFQWHHLRTAARNNTYIQSETND